MKLFKYEVTFEHLIMLVAILYVIFFFMQKREKFEQESKTETVKKDSRCGEESINYGYLHYVFNSPAVPRR